MGTSTSRFWKNYVATSPRFHQFLILRIKGFNPGLGLRSLHKLAFHRVQAMKFSLFYVIALVSAVPFKLAAREDVNATGATNNTANTDQQEQATNTANQQENQQQANQQQVNNGQNEVLNANDAQNIQAQLATLQAEIQQLLQLAGIQTQQLSQLQQTQQLQLQQSQLGLNNINTGLNNNINTGFNNGQVVGQVIVQNGITTFNGVAVQPAENGQFNLDGRTFQIGANNQVTLVA